MVEIVPLLNKIRENNKTTEKDLGDLIEHCQDDFEDILKMIDLREKQMTIYLEKIETQNTEIQIPKKDLEDLRLAVSESQQYSRTNSLEQRNYPTKKKENLLSIVKSIGNALGHDFTG